MRLSPLKIAIIYAFTGGLWIIKQHNGHLNVCSEHEKGTIFKIYLPIVKTA